VSARILHVQTKLQLADLIDRDLAALEQGMATPTAPPPGAWQDGTPHLSSIAMRSANVLFSMTHVDRELNPIRQQCRPCDKAGSIPSR